jgi:hypothetical protein
MKKLLIIAAITVAVAALVLPDEAFHTLVQNMAITAVAAGVCTPVVLGIYYATHFVFAPVLIWTLGLVARIGRDLARLLSLHGSRG